MEVKLQQELGSVTSREILRVGSGGEGKERVAGALEPQGAKSLPPRRRRRVVD